MAKCIQVVGQGIPVRMSDTDAFQVVVRDGDGQYCPKSMWRNWYDDPVDVGGTIQPGRIAKLVGDKITEARTLQRNLQHKRRSRH